MASVTCFEHDQTFPWVKRISPDKKRKNRTKNGKEHRKRRSKTFKRIANGLETILFFRRRNPLVLSVNPYMTNGFSHHYHLGESTLIFRGVRSDFEFLFYFLKKFLYANRIAPDVTPRSAASHLGLFCLPMSHKRDAWLNFYMLRIIFLTVF